MEQVNNLLIEMLTDLLAIDLNAVRDDNGDFELPRQHITREQLETTVAMIYDVITVAEVEKFGNKLMEDEYGK